MHGNGTGDGPRPIPATSTSTASSPTSSPRIAPKGLSEDVVRHDLGQEGRARVAHRVAAGRLPALADHGRSRPGRSRTTRRSTTRRISYYAAPAQKERPKSLDEIDPEIRTHLREARHPDPRAGDPGRRRRRLRVRQRLGRHHLQEEAAASWASSSARSPRRCRSIPSWCAAIWARWCRRATTSSPR